MARQSERRKEILYFIRKFSREKRYSLSGRRNVRGRSTRNLRGWN